MDGPSQNRGSGEPVSIASVLSEYIARKGLARVQGSHQLEEIWKRVSGDAVAAKTRVLKLSRGVLEVAVASSGLCSELAAFHKAGLVARLREEYPAGKIKDIRFRLRTQ